MCRYVVSVVTVVMSLLSLSSMSSRSSQGFIARDGFAKGVRRWNEVGAGRARDSGRAPEPVRSPIRPKPDCDRRGATALTVEKDRDGRVGVRHTGTLVDAVRPGGGAERAGITRGMRIRCIAGIELDRNADTPEVQRVFADVPRHFTVHVEEPPRPPRDAPPQTDNPPAPSGKGFQSLWKSQSFRGFRGLR
jgi:hypothetical protein